MAVVFEVVFPPFGCQDQKTFANLSAFVQKNGLFIFPKWKGGNGEFSIFLLERGGCLWQAVLCVYSGRGGKLPPQVSRQKENGRRHHAQK